MNECCIWFKKKKILVFFFSDELVKFIETRKTIQEVQREATKAEFIHQINNTLQTDRKSVV